MMYHLSEMLKIAPAITNIYLMPGSVHILLLMGISCGRCYS